MRLDIQTLMNLIKSNSKKQLESELQAQTVETSAMTAPAYSESISRKLVIYKQGALVKATSCLNTKFHRIGNKIRKDRKSLALVFAKIKEHREAEKQQTAQMRMQRSAVPSRRVMLTSGTTITGTLITAFAGTKNVRHRMVQSLHQA